MKLPICTACICALAFVGAGCGDDNDTLSYDDTGTEISAICERINGQTEELTGQPANDAPILETLVPDFEEAIQEVRDLDVDDELADTRDAFADNGEEQLAIIKEAQTAAESGDRKEYISTVRQSTSLDRESNELASQLGAEGCID